MRTLILATVARSPRSPTAARAGDRQADEFFESKVRPVLAENCFSCHGPDKQKGGLRLDSRAALLKGAGGEPVVVPGEPDKSPLIKAIRHDGDIKMPPKAKLPAPAIDALTAWVKMGVPWPEAAGAKAVSSVAEVCAEALGVPAGPQAGAAGGPAPRLGADAARPLHPGEAGRARAWSRRPRPTGAR